MHRLDHRSASLASRIRILGAVGVLVTALHAPAHAQGFTSTPIDFMGPQVNSGFHSLHVRNTSTPVYYLTYEGDTHLKYATKTGTGQWTFDPPQHLGALIERPLEAELAVPSTSPFNPHIAMYYTSQPLPWVRYATKNGGGWTIEDVIPRIPFPDTVETVRSVAIAMVGQQPCIAVSYDRASSPGHSFAYRLLIATRVSPGVWTREIVRSSDLPTGEREMTSVHIRATSAPSHHLSFHLRNGNNPQDNCIAYSTKVGGAWSTEPVIVNGALDLVPAHGFAFAAGIPQFAYSWGGQLRWAFRQAQPQGWPFTELGPCAAGTGPRGIAMTTDGGGYPLIAYVSVNEDSIRFASKSSSGWNFQRAAHHGFDGWSPLNVSIGLFTSFGTGKPQIVYPAGTAPELLNLASGTQYLANNSSASRPREEGPWVQDGFLEAVRFSRPMAIAPGGTVLRGGIRLLEASEVELKVHDVQGRLIASRTLGVLPAGEQTVELPAQRIAHGIYFVTARLATGASATAQVAVIR